MKISILSNINQNMLIRQLLPNCEVYEPEGFGNELGILINKHSNLYSYNPNIIFLFEDVAEISNNDINKATEYITQWFYNFEKAIDDKRIYYITDAYIKSYVFDVSIENKMITDIKYLWDSKLYNLIAKHNNVRVFKFSKIVSKLGEINCYNEKTWYLGRIKYSLKLQDAIKEEILHIINIETVIPKKVLLLDLDNTLWGGIAGENDVVPIVLSNEHEGLAYMDLQKVILQMKNNGVMLGIVSKNNESDVMDIINNHPFMVLKSDDFVIKRINWKHKYENIIEISKVLNVGLDSIVFFDDDATERQSIKEILPEIIVPDFPSKIENLSSCMSMIWRKYFDRAILTSEDKNKTTQYLSNEKREELKTESLSFNDYLNKLEIVLTRMHANKHIERITQLINKTNQFNITTIRHTENEIKEMLDNKNILFYVYNVSDKFGDNGIVAIVIVSIKNNIASIDEFVMSCRVMGKNIEYGIIDDVENQLCKKGINVIEAHFVKSKKNIPVINLFDSLGYSILYEDDSKKDYSLIIKNKTKRSYIFKSIVEEM